MSASFDLDYLAQLMRLNIKPEERTGIEEKLGSVMEMIDQVVQADTEGVEPLAHPLEIHTVLRSDIPDEPARSLRDWMQDGGAPETEDGFYTVPKVIP
ncbi:MAG: Asp-tRNA(Asn)/Glu-tRNA(Gln) amidotransferase subunit GatC [Gammaproteobacteria bacterium AqS3]|nr:Asp-tRNA(Asn)/Glu-tRNA(Gln) amidotransferase subunit GatC [Gammaproteobacteria bacterium AqS3]